MARLFVTQRELSFISDVTKELYKDVVGQCIAYYPISEIKTQTDDLYNESTSKVWDHPIIIEALVDSSGTEPTHVDKFGVDAKWSITVFLHYRDMIDKGINVTIGDACSFSDVMYEVTDRVSIKHVFGLPEDRVGIKLTCVKMRESQFKAPAISPTDRKYSDDDAVQEEFHQQRGFPCDVNGNPTGDKRDLIVNGALDLPVDGPREVSKKGDLDNTGSSFYDED